MVAMETPPRLSFGFESLDVYHLAIQFVALSSKMIAAFPPGNSALGDQLRRASTSVPLNIAEGSGRMRSGDEARHMLIARGSALECAAILDVCRALGLAARAVLDEARGILIRVVQMLTTMCR
jgi:four helix bundle protein